MSGAQPYNQLCPVATGLDLIGTRWAMLVVRELMLGPRRFSDILRGLESTSTDILTTRLRQLEESGLVERTEGRAYALTAAGYDLAPILQALTDWVDRHAKIPSTASMPDIEVLVRRVMAAVAVRLCTMTIKGYRGSYEVSCGELVVVASPSPGATADYRLTEKLPSDVSAEMAGRAEFEFGALAEFAMRRVSVDEMLSNGGLRADQACAEFLRGIS